MYTQPIRPNELYHHGILGMHWGIRRYQPYPKGYKGSGKEIGEAKRKIYNEDDPTYVKARKVNKHYKKQNTKITLGSGLLAGIGGSISYAMGLPMGIAIIAVASASGMTIGKIVNNSIANKKMKEVFEDTGTDYNFIMDLLNYKG